MAESITITPVTPSPGSTGVAVSGGISFIVSGLDYRKDGYPTLTIEINNNEIDTGLFSVEETGAEELTYTSSEVLQFKYGSTYAVNVREDDSEQERSWSFSTENGYTNRETVSLENYYYPVTQYMANGFPYESRIRNNRYSHGQMFLNQFSPILDQVDEDTSKAVRNQLPRLCDTTEINTYAWAHVNSFEFKSRFLPNGEKQYILPTVRGTYDNYHGIVINPVDGNNIENLEEALPLYYWGSKIATMPSTVTSFRFNAELDDEVETYNARPLFVKISSGEGFVSRLGPNSYRMAYLEIEGLSDRWIVEKEKVSVFYNGIYMSTRNWRRVDSIKMRNHLGVDTDSIEIEYSFYPGGLGTEDQPISEENFSAPVAEDNELRRMWWSYTKRSLRSDILTQHVTIAKTADEYADLTSDLDSFSTIELLDSDRNELDISAIWPDKNDRYLYVLGSPRGDYAGTKYLYLYDKHDEYMPKVLVEELKNDNGDSLVEIDITADSTTLSEDGNLPIEVSIYANSVYARLARIRTKVSYLDDDGNVVHSYFDPSDGSFHSSFGWHENKNEIFTKLSFDTIMTKCGFYIFTVEFITLNREIGSISKVLQVKDKTPVATYKLGFIESGETATDLFVDSDNQINLVTLKGSSEVSFYQLNPFYNYYAIDFVGNKIMCNGSFDALELFYYE